MQRIIPFFLLLAFAMTACESGGISTTDPNSDETNPNVRLAATFNDGETTTIDVESDSPLGGGSETITLDPGDVVLFTANIDDPEGVKEAAIWPIGASFTTSQLNSSAYINTDPTNAFSSIDRALTYEVTAGSEARFFANARNFGGGFFGVTTASSGNIIVKGTGSLPSLPAGVLSQEISLTIDMSTGCYQSPAGASPPTGATIVGVSVVTAPSTDFVSLAYSTVSDPTTLDTRMDFERLLEGTSHRVDFFNGPWGSGRWYGIRGIRKTTSGAGTFKIRVYYTV